ncbi:MAG: D-glycerate dehydrogenase, partial [Desulfobacteraceae bacterium]|nr:D-glycerate dehydrogenase [Desulfobacteraceae bacterium]
MGNQIKILVTRDFPDIGIQLLTDQGFDLTIWTNKKPMTKAQFIENAQGHEALLCTLTEEIDKTFLLACPHLKMISQFAVGYDNIDIKEATILGIPVGFTPDAMTEATADIAFGLMIAVSRKFFFLHKTILHGQWDYFTPKANLGI